MCVVFETEKAREAFYSTVGQPVTPQLSNVGRTVSHDG
jgi:hypothetical protein